MESTSGSAQAESALFDDDDEDEDTKPKSEGVKMTEQRLKSLDKTPLKFEGLSEEGGHRSQTVRELQTIHGELALSLAATKIGRGADFSLVRSRSDRYGGRLEESSGDQGPVSWHSARLFARGADRLVLQCRQSFPELVISSRLSFVRCVAVPPS